MERRVAECEARGVDACGENGEFHTVVTEGPAFAWPLVVRRGAVSDHGGYAMLDLMPAAG